MNKEEAIKTLKENSCSICSYCAKNMESCSIAYCDNRAAIRTLEQETCEDCVSREELKKWLDMNFSFGGALRKLELFDRLDKELPSVTPKPKWIPVSERLPELGHDVLGIDPYNDVLQAYTYDDCGEIKWVSDRGSNTLIVAWRPLPEPYQEEKE